MLGHPPFGNHQEERVVVSDQRSQTTAVRWPIDTGPQLQAFSWNVRRGDGAMYGMVWYVWYVPSWKY